MSEAGSAIAGLRHELCVAMRAAALYGMTEAIDNHFSAAIPGSGDFLVNRYGPHWSEVVPEDLVVVDPLGTVVDGAGSVDAAAMEIHRAVHAARASARVVMHLHMPWATALGTIAEGLLTNLTPGAMRFHGRVVDLPYDGLATQAAEGERIRAFIRSRDADVVLMRNHGVMVIGSTVPEAWHRLYFLERAAQVQVLAMSTGRSLVLVDDETAAKTAAQWAEIETEIADDFFIALRRLVASPPQNGGLK